MTSCVKLSKRLTYFENLDSKSDAFLNTCFKTWYFSKVMIRKLFFLPFFRQLVVFEKTHNCKSWRFHGLKRSKMWHFLKGNIHQSLFLYKSIALQNLMRCKTFFRNATRSKIFDSKNPELWKIGSKSDAFKFLDCKYDALYKKWFKNWLFSKKLIQNSFSLKTTFSGTTISKMHKKPTLTL